MSDDRIRLRLHWGGAFFQAAGSTTYAGGEVFNESVAANIRYADLCLKLNDKVGYTTSIKYQAPGEELSPNELVSISGDDDLAELHDEYLAATARPGTALKTFRVKIFLFPALQDELDTEALSFDPLGLWPMQQHQAQHANRLGHSGGGDGAAAGSHDASSFDPDEWYAPSDGDDNWYMDDASRSAATAPPPMAAVHGGGGVGGGVEGDDGDASGADCADDMQWQLGHAGGTPLHGANGAGNGAHGGNGAYGGNGSYGGNGAAMMPPHGLGNRHTFGNRLGNGLGNGLGSMDVHIGMCTGANSGGGGDMANGNGGSALSRAPTRELSREQLSRAPTRELSREQLSRAPTRELSREQLSRAPTRGPSREQLSRAPAPQMTRAFSDDPADRVRAGPPGAPRAHPEGLFGASPPPPMGTRDGVGAMDGLIMMAALGGGGGGGGGRGLRGETVTPRQERRVVVQAMGNLVASVSRSFAHIGRPMMTHEFDLMDPYHEDDESGLWADDGDDGSGSGTPAALGGGYGCTGNGHGHGPRAPPRVPSLLQLHQQQQQRQQQQGVVPRWTDAAGAAAGAIDAATPSALAAALQLPDTLDLPASHGGGHDGGGCGGGSLGAHALSRLDPGRNLPTHISEFGGDCGDGGRGGGGGGHGSTLHLPVTLGSALGGGGHGGGGGGGSEGKGVNGGGAAAMRDADFDFPSHISVFGSSSHTGRQGGEGDDDSAAWAAPGAGQRSRRGGRGKPQAPGRGGGGAHAGVLVTQEFSRHTSAGGPGGLGGPGGIALPQSNGGGGGAGGEGDEGPLTSPGGTPGTPGKRLDGVVRVPLDEVVIIRKIGEGAFGEVSFANVQSHGLVAVKWLKRERFAKYSESFMQEAEVLAKLNHPNIIRMYGVVIEKEDSNSSGRPSSGSSGSGSSARASAPAPQIAGIMTDYVRGGSLSGQLRAAKRRPTLRERCQVAVQAARGMAYLHAQTPAVIHFDLKPDNLLVDGDSESLHVKVADFGLSKHKFQNFVSCRDLRGTLPYMAPELVSNPMQVSEKCDVWSMGVVMWEMYTLEVPYKELSAQQILLALMQGSIHLHVPSSCEPEWRGLIEMCMDNNPSARPSFKQLTAHLDALQRMLWTGT